MISLEHERLDRWVLFPLRFPAPKVSGFSFFFSFFILRSGCLLKCAYLIYFYFIGTISVMSVVKIVLLIVFINRL